MLTVRECVQIYLTQETFRTVWGENMRFAQNQGAWDCTPVRRGQWTEPDNFDLGFWQCSQCGFLSEAAAANRLYNYCPNCGAKMEDVDNE